MPAVPPPFIRSFPTTLVPLKVILLKLSSHVQVTHNGMSCLLSQDTATNNDDMKKISFLDKIFCSAVLTRIPLYEISNPRARGGGLLKRDHAWGSNSSK
jgi:hypothetical protein